MFIFPICKNSIWNLPFISILLADKIMKLLKYFHNLKRLWICLASLSLFLSYWISDPAIVLRIILSCLNMNEIRSNYQVIHVEQFIVFYKKTFQIWFFSIYIPGTAYDEEIERFLFILLLSQFLKELVRTIFFQYFI